MTLPAHVAATNQPPPGDPAGVTFETAPDRYRHWKLVVERPLAFLVLRVDEAAGLAPGYVLKRNSYDLGVDIELYDAVQRLRFEHPEVGAVVITGGGGGVFCAGANIPMLAGSSHGFKVNFCKFTNETRNAIEDASRHSGQRYIAALNGTASGGGYELALATEHIILVDDGSSVVSLPEVPLLAVLPGTGGLTRLVDKRRVRRDRADVFATRSEGIRGQTAVAWGLVDELVPRSRFEQVARESALAVSARSDRPRAGSGIVLTPLARTVSSAAIHYRHVRADLDRARGLATISVRGPEGAQPADPPAIEREGAACWSLAAARELDDLLLHLRFSEPELGILVLRTEGDPVAVAQADEVLLAHADHWLVREIILYWKRTLSRLELSSRSAFALIEPGSCFVGTLFELALAADRGYMLDGTLEDGEPRPAQVCLTGMNFGPLPMSNGLTRLESRFLGQPERVETLRRDGTGRLLGAREALDRGLVTFAPDDIDWQDEVRLALEERASFSPDALTGMEASLRFCGPETTESKIFARLSAWQNWIFQRPNAVGEEGALRRYGSGKRATFDRRRA